MGSDGGGRSGNADGTLSAGIAQKGTYRRSARLRGVPEWALGCSRSSGDLPAQRPAPRAGWFLTIARRLCVDGARAQDRQAALALALAGLAVAGAAPGSPEPIETQLEAARHAHALRRAVAALPVEQRAVVALQLWDGLDYEEIAAVEAAPVGTVRSRLARAQASLRGAPPPPACAPPVATPPPHGDVQRRSRG